MSSNKTPEHRITVKIALIFLVVILFFVGLFVYSSILKKDIDEQQRDMDEAYRIVVYSNNLINSIQEAQGVLNRYLVAPNKIYVEQYDSVFQDISEQIENIKQENHQNYTNLPFDNIDSLLNEKRVIVNRLIGLFRSQNPLLEFDRKIETIEPIIQDTTVVITNVDTVVVNKQKRGFWNRLTHLIKPSFDPDTTISITHTEKEERAATRVDTVMFSDLRSISEEASKTYLTQIDRIERQVRELVLSDQQISLNISKLISQLYYEALQTTRQGAENSESLSQKILSFAITIGALSIFLILIITLFIYNDLNKGKRARIELSNEKQKTEELIESRHKLLLSVSHDIKTPLSSIMGYMEIWDAEVISETVKRQLKSARNSGRHILSLLTNLLEFSRLEQRTVELKLSTFDLIELIDEILSMFRPFTDDKGLALSFNYNITSPYYIESDYTALKQILINIISNAVKYTLKGSVEVNVDESSDNVLLIKIKDTGVGISNSDITKIFKPFSRVENSSKSEGSGFGLYVTKGLTESLNGDITMSSEKGVGTNVLIKLPVKRVENFIPEDVDDSFNIDQREKKYSKILIFEDDISLGNLIKEFLIQKGFKVKLCNNPRDINGFIRVIDSFDIVLTDMQMIESSGTEILYDIRQNNSDIPVWLMTANHEYSNDKAELEGFSGLIKKPIQMNMLLNTLYGSQNKKEIYSEEVESNELTLNGNSISEKFPKLASMFGNDQESIKGILADFVENSEKDNKKLEEFIKNNQFKEAQEICHKIHPFYSQLDAEYLTFSLRKMDSLRVKDESSYPQWKEEVTQNLDQIREFTVSIRENYL